MARDVAYREAGEMIDSALLDETDSLDLSDMSLTELPEMLGALSTLQELDLSGNELTELPESVGRLTQLWTLDVSSNRLTELPEWLNEFVVLQELGAYRNQLCEVPETIGELAQLRTLRLGDNQLRDLPDSLHQLSQLEELYLSDNHLTMLPEWLGQLSKLKLLHLVNNQLTTLPQSIGNLSQLRTLRVSENQLAMLPNSLAQLSRLKSLHLVNNQLAALPERLSDLAELEVFAVSGNQLETVPDSLSQLSRLTSLDLSDNQLTAVPNSFAGLEGLDRLFLHGNESLAIPREILGPTLSELEFENRRAADPATILNYYFSTRGVQGQALREVKLIVVGRGGVGKTSLIRRLNGKPLDPNESETHGIVISPLTLNCDDGPVSARVWDFGGQHVLHAMHEFFLTARSLYLLVLGEREEMSERDAAYWLQLIRSYAGSAPVVVALNKSEGCTREMDRESLEENYGPILGWVATECSAGADTTIDELRAALTRAAEQMPEVRDLFPAKWWEIKQSLENMTEPFLDFGEFQARCAELGETDSDNQETLAAWLNDLGVAINYGHDTRLHDTTVLRPDWLANGIYAILRANDSRHDKQFAPGAIVTLESLGPIYAASEKMKMLKSDDYPAEKWPFLLRLMGLFQLAFPLDDNFGRLLVPSLLPVEPPPQCNEPVTAGRTRLRYEFTVVPGPLLPRLLVRTFSLIDGARCWRRGAVLLYGDARARVWTTQDERWLHVTANGTERDREDLLTMIRCTLEELFTEYEDLHAVEQWEYGGNWVPKETLKEIGVLPDTKSGWGGLR